MKTTTCAVLLLFFASSLPATTKAVSEAPDPLSDGVCQGAVAASWGSYIYRWPSKYDQVFWPHTDPDFIWYCEESGFIAFSGDLELGDEEKSAVAAFLADRPKSAAADLDLATRIDLLEQVYEIRDKDAHHRNWRWRVFAYIAESRLDDPDRAAEFRRRALIEIETALEGDLPANRRLEYHFLAARYSLAFGENTASELHGQELATLAAVADEEFRGYADYLIETLAEYRSVAAESAETN